MNQDTIRLVQQSWRQVTPSGPQVATQFYQTLFRLDPSLRPLFRGDMEDQGAKLVQMIDVAVDKLDDLDRLVPTLQSLGRRHAAYGVQNAAYDTVGTALLHTLAEGLGDAFSDEVRAAWISVYGTMSKVMTDAAVSHAEPARVVFDEVKVHPSFSPGSMSNPLNTRA